MSGGRLVVLDRAGRDVKRYSLPSGLVTIGKDPSCDIRVMLPAVSAHHATVVVRSNQTVILRSVSEKDTLVNGKAVSVVALQHGDTITLGDRSLRWEYQQPPAKTNHQSPAFVAKKGPPARNSRGKARTSETSVKRVDRDVEMMLEMRHRASMPPQVSGSGAKQVAVVQPQRRDANELQESKAGSASKRQRTSLLQRQDSPKLSPSKLDLQSPTKASLWIESRKSSPRKVTLQTPPVRTHSPPRRALSTGKKATPLRTAVLRKTVTPSHRVAKIHAPTTIDYTKQAALMLMARHHTPKTVIPSSKTPAKRGPSLLVKKLSPVTPRSGRKSPKSGKSTPKSAKATTKAGGRQSLSLSLSTPRDDVTNVSGRSSRRHTGAEKSISIFEISDTRTSKSRSRITPFSSPLPSPKKSSLKNPKSARKNESIKFDLSNLENFTHDQSNDVFILSDVRSTSKSRNTTTQYSDTLTSISPSPRRSIHSRASKILGSTLGTSIDSMQSVNETRTLTPQSNRSQRSSIIVQNALSSPKRQSSKSPKSPKRKVETYSIVDLVDDQSSLYDSVSTSFGTPQSRKTRSTLNALGSSTPYVNESKRKSSLNKTSDTFVSERSSSKRSKSAPNSARASRRSGFSDVIEISGAGDASTKRSPRSKSLDSTAGSAKTRKSESSPKTPLTSPRISKSPISSPKTNLSNRRSKTPRNLTVNLTASKPNASPKPGNKRKSLYSTPTNRNGQVTPDNQTSPEDIGTPVLNIQSLLDSSMTQSKRQSLRKSGNKTFSGKVTKAKSNRKASKSLSAIKTVLTRRSKDSSGASDGTDENAAKPSNEDTITPKSTVKLVQEAVKDKHSTAKKPVSKRSIIDNLNDSDVVKDLFSSPVKRNLSRSMTEFTKTLNKEKALSRKGRKTIALGRTPDHSLLNNTDTVPTDVFVSPLTTPSSSPARRMHASNTPKSPQAVKHLIRSPRTRKSIKNDLTNVSGVKDIFARSPNNDLRRVSGVKSLFQSEKKTGQPKNSLTNVAGVRKLYKKNSPKNDLTNVSGVKKTLAKSPRNDLRDVRGVKKLFAKNRSAGLSDLSGVEELFDDSKSDRALNDSEILFDRLVGKPIIKATYSRSFLNKSGQKSKRSSLSAKSLNRSYNDITSNVEKWIEDQLKLRLSHDSSANKSANRSNNKSKNTSTKSVNKSNNKSGNVSKALQNLFTDTVEGTTPLQKSRIRTTLSTSAGTSQRKSASDSYRTNTLPLKKRSLERSGNKRSLERSANDRSLLPIKKRAIVSSTPVKGKAMQAVDLGRVSPIIDYVEADVRSPTRSPRPSKRSLSILPASPKQMPVLPVSPKRTPNSPKSQISSPKAAKSRSVLSPKIRKTATPKITSRTSIVSPTSKTLTPKAQNTPKVTPKTKTLTPKSVSRKSKTPTLLVTPKTVTKKSKPSPKTTPKVASPKKLVGKSKESVSPRKSLSKTPKVVIKTPKSASAKKSAPKSVSAKKMTPKPASAKKSTPKSVSARKSTPKSSLSPKLSTPTATLKAVSAKKTLKSVSPKKATPKLSSPRKQVTPTAVSLEKLAPKIISVASSPKIVSPKPLSMKLSTPKSPRKSLAKIVSPKSPKKSMAKIVSPKTVTPRKTTPKLTAKKSISALLSPRKSVAKSPKTVTPRQSSAKSVVAKKVMPVKKAISPKIVSPKPVTPKAQRQTRKAQSKVITPKKASPKQTQAAPKVVVSPKKVVLSPKPRATRAKVTHKAVSPKKVTPKTKPVSPKKVTPKKKAVTKPVSAPISPKSPKAKRVRRPKKAETIQESPKKVTPIKKTTRGKSAKETLSNTKKKQATLVVTKKSPLASPAPKPTRRGRLQKESQKKVTPKSSPVKPRRGAKPQVISTPKQSRAKAKQATVVVTKPSPQIKPAGKISPAKPTRGRPKKVVKTPSSIKPKGRQTKKAVSPAKKAVSPVKKGSVTPKKGPKAAKVAKTAPETPKRGKTAPKSPSPKKRGRKAVAKSPVKKVATPKIGRKRKLAEIEESPLLKKGKVPKNISPVKPTPKGRAKAVKEAKSAAKDVVEVKGRRGKAVEKIKSPQKPVKETPKRQKAQQPALTKEAPKGRKRKPEPSPAAIIKQQAGAKRSRVAASTAPSPAKTKRNAAAAAPAPATGRSRRR